MASGGSLCVPFVAAPEFLKVKRLVDALIAFEKLTTLPNGVQGVEDVLGWRTNRVKRLDPASLQGFGRSLPHRIYLALSLGYLTR